jgi:transposase
MSDLTDHEWNTVRHLFEDTGTRRTIGRPSTNARTVLNAILWIQRSGERWLYLPTHFPPQQTCYSKYLVWKKDGRLGEVARLLASGACPSREQSDPSESGTFTA